MAAASLQAGQQPTQSRMERPLSLQGVGEGTHTALWETRIPVAVPDGDGRASLHTFEAPTVGGTGSDLPALLGLRSMRAKQSVLEMGPGRERLSFPGPGGYEVTWSPGTIHLPLVVAPSGHYVIPCDSFGQVQPQSGGLAARTMALHTWAEGPPRDAAAADSSPDAAAAARDTAGGDAAGGSHPPPAGPALHQ